MPSGNTFTRNWNAASNSGRMTITDPGDAGSVTVANRIPARWGLVTAAAETRTLASPVAEGQLLFIHAKTIVTSCTMTVTNGFDEAGNTSLVFSTAGDYIILYSVEVGSNYRWRVVSSAGVTGPLTKIGSLDLEDNEYVDFGTGNDLRMMWNASYLQAGPASGMWAAAPSPAQPNYASVAHRILDDFHTLDTTATVGDWAAFNVGTGTTTLADDVAGGVLLMTCQATTDDACEQLNYVSASVMLAAGKTIWYETRLKQVGDVQSEVSFGLVALGEDLTAVADVYPADGISFAHQDASMALALTASKGGTNTGASAGVKTMVTNVYATYGLLIDGVTSITPYIDGVAGTAITATIPDDESLSPYFLVRNGDNVTQQVLHVDYVETVQLR